MRRDFKEVIRTTGVFQCMDCGKCTSVCPISIRDSRFSPRKTVLQAVHEGLEQCAESELQWLCLTCNMCTNRCPMGVEFIDFIRDIRDRSTEIGNPGACTHGCAIRSWGEMMALEETKPDRLGWITDDLRVAETGDVAYFVGCLPLYSRFFTDYAPDAVETARNTVRVLNRIGIEPVILGDEVCCGHDFLWSGEGDTFESLARRNIEAFSGRGIETIVTACAECFRTLKMDYPALDAGFSAKVRHTAEFFGEKIGEGRLEANGFSGNGRVTYHDPCRLSKHLGVMEAPRALIGRIEGIELAEMPRSGTRSVCCGTSLWMNCNWISKEMQIDRIREAVGTGSETMVTTCPKCMIHFRCAMSETDDGDAPRIAVKDLNTLLAESLAAGGDGTA